MTITKDDFWFLNFIVAGGGEIGVAELTAALAPDDRERFTEMLPSLTERELIDLWPTDTKLPSSGIYSGKISITQAGRNAHKDFKK